MFAAMAEAALEGVSTVGSWGFGKRGFGRKRGDLQHEISVDEIVQCLQENRKETEACEEPRKRRHDPVDTLLVAGPSKPEQPHRERRASNDDRRKAPFWDRDVVIRCEFLIV